MLTKKPRTTKSSPPPQPLRPRHVPQRTCVACRRTGDKRDFVRIVRTADGHVRVDPTGKLAGRGAYLCKRPECFTKALARKDLERALAVTLNAEDKAAIAAYAETLPPVPAQTDETDDNTTKD